MELSEGCVAHILSYTTPVDACRLSLVSKTFYVAAQSDTVWDKFLPSDLMSIISRSDSESSLLANSPSKKSLYLSLSRHPIIINHASKSFQLDGKSGKKCYMLAARALNIAWGDNPQYWNWINLPESRFPEVAQLVRVCWLEIRGAITTNAFMSPKTNYAVYLVFKMIDADGFNNHPVELSVDIVDGLYPFLPQLLRPRVLVRSPPDEVQQMNVVETNGDIVGGQSCTNTLLGLQFPGRLRHPRLRSDGWLEIEMGVLYHASGLIDYEVRMSVLETKGGNWKSGLFIEGIEVRPSNQSSLFS